MYLGEKDSPGLLDVLQQQFINIVVYLAFDLQTRAMPKINVDGRVMDRVEFLGVNPQESERKAIVI